MSDWKIFKAESFSSLRSSWDSLNRAGPDSPLLHSDFIAPAIQAFGCHGLFIAVNYKKAKPMSMTLLVRHRLGCWTTFQPSQLPISPWIQSETANIADDLRNLCTVLPSPVFMFSLTQLDPMYNPRPINSRHLETLDYIPTARIIVEPSFQTYWNNRGRNLRRTIKRQSNSLVQQDIQTRLETVTAPNEVSKAMADYATLESAGWKGKEGTAVVLDSAQGRFYQQVLTNFCSRGAGRIYRYWYNDNLVACDLCIMQGKILVVLKTTYDETISTSSPAMLMRHAYFQQIFAQENTVDSIEFYGKAMDWHRKLTEDIRWLYHVNYFPFPLVKTLRHWRR